MQIKDELVRLCWYMRGGLDYETAHYLGVEDRKIMAALAKENIETVKKTKMPLL